MVVTIHTGSNNSNHSCQVGYTDRGESGLGGVTFTLTARSTWRPAEDRPRADQARVRSEGPRKKTTDPMPMFIGPVIRRTAVTVMQGPHPFYVRVAYAMWRTNFFERYAAWRTRRASSPNRVELDKIPQGRRKKGIRRPPR